MHRPLPRARRGHRLARGVLTPGVLIGSLVLVTGCTGTSPGPAARLTTPAASAVRSGPGADDLARARSVRVALTLLAAIDAWQVQHRTSHGARARAASSLLDAVAADHRLHLSALGALPGRTAPSAPSGTAPTVAQLADEEAGAASDALAQVTTVSGPLAALLARIAASRAGHADLLATAAGSGRHARYTAPPPAPAGAAGTVSATTTSHATSAPAPSSSPPSTPGPTASPTSTGVGTRTGTDTGTSPRAAPSDGPDPAAPQSSVLLRLLAGERAAAWAYGAVAARLHGDDQQRAESLWAEHARACRDLLVTLEGLGVGAPPAPAGYDVGRRIRSRSQAITLATEVEQRLAETATAVVAEGRGTPRAVAAATLVATGRRLTEWRGRPVALPG